MQDLFYNIRERVVFWKGLHCRWFCRKSLSNVSEKLLRKVPLKSYFFYSRYETFRKNLCWYFTNTAQKIKFSNKDFFNKCDQIRSFPQIWSNLLKKSLMENFIFCKVEQQTLKRDLWSKYSENFSRFSGNY